MISAKFDARRASPETTSLGPPCTSHLLPGLTTGGAGRACRVRQGIGAANAGSPARCNALERCTKQHVAACVHPRVMTCRIYRPNAMRCDAQLSVAAITRGSRVQRNRCSKAGTGSMNSTDPGQSIDRYRRSTTIHTITNVVRSKQGACCSGLPATWCWRPPSAL